MEATIQRISQKTLIGLSTERTIADEKVRDLWQTFMPLQNNIPGKVDANYYSVQIYPDNLSMERLTPHTIFETWAAVEVTEVKDVPSGLKPFYLKGGYYAVFVHHGPASTFPDTWRSIFFDWLPSSGYELDRRPHFEILPPTYRPNDPNATEEVWIPITAESLHATQK